jgi:hypothetical protein
MDDVRDDVQQRRIYKYLRKYINHLELFVDTLVDLFLVDASESLQYGNGPVSLPLRQQPPVKREIPEKKIEKISYYTFFFYYSTQLN